MKFRVGALLPLSFSLIFSNLACSSDDQPGVPGSGGSGSGGSSGLGGMGGTGATGSGGGSVVMDGTCADAECSPNAECLDLDKGYQCVCNTGFEGDGVSCESSAACEGVVCTGIGQVCQAIEGTAVCVCPDGYSSNPAGDCYDQNECVTDPNICGSQGTCTNFPGGYRCDCRPGFEKVDGDCVDINECDLDLDLCASNAICTNVPGTYSCSCPVGTFGDGSFCKLSNDCTGSPCGSGQCINSPSGFYCQCPLGTTGADCSDTSSCSLSTVLNDSGTPIIADDTLRAVIEAALGIPSGGSLTVADLAGTTSLSVLSSNASKISSLEGLQCWPTLENLNIADQSVSDLSPLSYLTQLQTLNISCNEVTDVGPLSTALGLRSFTNARSSFTCDTAPKLSSIAGLASLYRMSDLSVIGHNISDISVLATLVKLRTLNLSQNALTSLDSLASLSDLEELYAGENAVSSVALLAGLQRLLYLGLNTNDVDAFDGIDMLTQLVYLDLSNNDISDTSGVEKLEALGELLLRNNSIVALDDIAQLTQLSRLQLTTNDIASLSPLVQNSSFTGPGQLLLNQNPFVCADEATNLAALKARGFTIYSDCK